MNQLLEAQRIVAKFEKSLVELKGKKDVDSTLKYFYKSESRFKWMKKSFIQRNSPNTILLQNH